MLDKENLKVSWFTSRGFRKHYNSGKKVLTEIKHYQDLKNQELEDINYEQLGARPKEIGKHEAKSLSSSPVMESQATPLTAEPVNKTSSSTVSKSLLKSGYLLTLDDALDLEKKRVGAKKLTLLKNVKDTAYKVRSGQFFLHII